MPDAAEPEIRTSARLVPEQRNTSGFDIVHTFSTRHQRFAFARLLSPYLTRSSLAFSSTLPSRPGEFHPEPLPGRVEDWRAGLGRGVSAMATSPAPSTSHATCGFCFAAPSVSRIARPHSLHVEAYGTYPAGTTFSPSRRTR